MAVELGKPLIFVKETDPAHGAAQLSDLELEKLGLGDKAPLADVLISHFAEALEWHREVHLKQCVVSMIVRQLPCLALSPQAGGGGSSNSHLEQDSKQRKDCPS